ncbi:MAG: hypothetical protein IKJ41_05110 [Clostridia bacterium]|nr:hypothetical protein [Clostridia bacterium]
MGYPRLINWAGIRKPESGQLLIKDFVCGDEYSLTPSEARFLKKLDGMVFHEVGHMFACLSYGGRFFEVGVITRFFFPRQYMINIQEV